MLRKLGVLCLALAAAAAACSCHSVGRAAGPRLEPLTVEVLDDDTGRPVPEFRFRYYTETAGLYAPSAAFGPWQHRDASDGPLTLQLPRTCLLWLQVDAPGYVIFERRPTTPYVLLSAEPDSGGYPPATPWSPAHLLDDEPSQWPPRPWDNPVTDRHLVVEEERGLRVEGTVRDAQTGEPIEGALVTLLVAGWGPIPYPDRAVTSDAAGHFAIDGVYPRLGIRVSRPGYAADDPILIAEDASSRTFPLTVEVALERSGVTTASEASGEGCPEPPATEPRISSGARPVGDVGELRGRVFAPGTSEPWPFAAVRLRHVESGDACTVRADEFGRFAVSNVPVGEVEVRESHHLSLDIIWGADATVTVAGGRVAEVMLRPTADWD